MTSIQSKIFEMFKNLKSDAMPRPPRAETRQTSVENDENIDCTNTNEPEEITVESDDENAKKNKKPKFKKSFFNTKKEEKSDKWKKNEKNGISNVNTQAAGNVINIVNSKNVRWGNDYYMGPTNMKPKNNSYTEDAEEHIAKDNLIQLLLEAQIKPEHEFIDYVSKNLGKNWHSFFRTLGFTKGAIETKEIDTASYGVSEARYKLLLDWINNDSDGTRTLGHLANVLWQEGERQVVKELSILYKRSYGKK